MIGEGGTPPLRRTQRTNENPSRGLPDKPTLPKPLENPEPEPEPIPSEHPDKGKKIDRKA